MMKKKSGVLFATMFMGLALLTACAMTSRGTAPAFDAQPIQGGQWMAKADHLVFVLDASSSMGWAYGGQKKFDIAKGIVSHFNQTMPDLNIQATLRGFGLDPFVSLKGTDLFYGPETYSRNGLAAGLDKITGPGGPSPMTKALNAAGGDLSESQGPIAMVIISDGKALGSGPLAAVGHLADQFGDRLCIYTVLVGDATMGRQLLEQIASTTACGQFTTADSLGSGAAMAAFVQQVLLEKPTDSDGDGVPDDRDACRNTPRGLTVDADGCPLDSDGDGVYDHLDRCPNTTPRGAPVDKTGCLLDTDGDGVYDYMDKCPDTPRGAKVDADGCPLPAATKSALVTSAGTWLYKGVQFETNKAEIKASSYPILDEIVVGLTSQPGLNAEIQGHTDSRGKRAYNQGLSERRAQAVRQYLIDKGIASHRLTAKGYGPDRPIASNTSAQGRAQNRRVELKPLQ